MPPRPDNACQWLGRTTALRTFATYTGQTQSQAHIKPLHWYVACRLVVEGGFRPEEITPRPPFRALRRQGWEPSTTRRSPAAVKRPFWVA